MIDLFVCVKTSRKKGPPPSLRTHWDNGSFVVVTKEDWRRWLMTLEDVKGWTPTATEFIQGAELVGETFPGFWVKGSKAELPVITTRSAYQFVAEAHFWGLRKAGYEGLAKTHYQKGWSAIPPVPTKWVATEEPLPKEMEAYKKFLDSFKFKGDVPDEKAHLVRLCDPEQKLFNLAKAKYLKNAK